jgi:hypothetical protein
VVGTLAFNFASAARSVQPKAVTLTYNSAQSFAANLPSKFEFRFGKYQI